MISLFLCRAAVTITVAQTYDRFPVDPYPILKTWSYEDVTKNLGPAEEIIDTLYNQAYLAGYRYDSEWFGVRGRLDFLLSDRGVSRIQFRNERPEKVIPLEVSDQIMRDTTFRNEFNRREYVADSLRRDSICSAISGTLGQPISYGPTPTGEKNARFQSMWISHGVACSYKDYLNGSEISFSIAQTPDWAVRDFDLPESADLIKKERINMRRSSWTASLLAEPADVKKPGFNRIYLLFEFDSGQRYAEMLPSSDSISGMPDMSFDDLNGDAFPDAWIKIPLLSGLFSRHYIYTLEFKEPLLLFDSGAMLPSQVSLKPGRKVEVDFNGGTVLEFSLQGMKNQTDFYNQDGALRSAAHMEPAGFNSLEAGIRNKNGSVDLAGHLDIRFPGLTGSLRFIVKYGYTSGGWEPVALMPED